MNRKVPQNEEAFAKLFEKVANNGNAKNLSQLLQVAPLLKESFALRDAIEQAAASTAEFEDDLVGLSDAARQSQEAMRRAAAEYATLYERYLRAIGDEQKIRRMFYIAAYPYIIIPE